MLSRVARIGLQKVAPASAQAWYLRTSVATFARVTRGRKSGGSSSSSSGSGDQLAEVPPPAAVSDPALAWTPVTDPASGNVYWWNTVTNETTYIGAPKPLGATLATSPNYAAVAPGTQAGGIMQQAPQQGGGMLSGLGSVMAQGFAFGTGSAVAHNVVGSMFGGSSSSGGSSDSGSSGDGDSWEM